MTLPVDQSTKLGALLGACREYPGGVRRLAADLDMPESTLYAKLRGEKGYPLLFRDESELDEILAMLRAKGVADWDKAIRVLCHQHGLLAVRLPSPDSINSNGAAQHISRVMQEVSRIASEISEAVSSAGECGADISAKEMRRIDDACNNAMERICEARRWCAEINQKAAQ